MTPLPLIERTFRMLWYHYYDDLVNDRRDSEIFQDHLYLNLNQIRTRFPEINSLKIYPYAQQPPEIIVRDFLAGMTDQYFWELSKQIDPSIEFTPAPIY